MAKPKSTIIPRAVNINKVENTNAVNSTSTILTRDTKVQEHLENKDIHVDSHLRDSINYARKDIEKHSSDENVHVTKLEKATWNAKESSEAVQSKVNKVNNSLQLHTSDSTIHLTKSEKDSLKDKYTRSEVRNLLKHALTGLVFLESVNNRSDLEVKYPKPEFNSCVYIRSAKITVIYNGKKWVDFNGLFAPELTTEFDGLMTKDDKIKLDSIEENANFYSHPDDIDTRHVSDYQINYWDKKADNELASVFNDGLMSKTDKVKLDFIDEKANYYEHPEKHYPSIIEQDENNRFVSDEQISKWDNKPEKDYIDTAVNNTLSAAKAFTDTKVAGMFNSSEAQLEVIRSLAFEFKRETVVKNFIDRFNDCVKNEEFQQHSLNNKIHMNRNDIALLENVKSLLETGMNPDFNEKDPTSHKYIENVPESLPANGGNSDTVGNYKPEDLFDNRSFYDYTIGIPKYTNEQVSVTTTDDTVLSEIESIINSINTRAVLFRPGEYYIGKEIIIRAWDSTIEGIGDASILLDATIRIIGDNNTIKNISLESSKNVHTDRPAIIIEGDNNTIINNSIMRYKQGILIEGSNNNIINNKLHYILGEAIKISADTNSNYGNIIDKNKITRSNLGIVLMSSKNTLTKNHIINNNISGFSSGIVLSNTINDNTKTTMNIINGNIVVRGNGNPSDYLSTYKTIVSEFSSKNIISSNITLGKKIIAPYDAVSNNIS